MSRGSIVGVRRTRSVDRREAVLESAWLHRLDAPSWESPAGVLSVESGQPLDQSADGDVVLVMTKPGGGAALEHAAGIGRGGARVYVLAEQGWTPTGTPLEHVPRVLVRRVAEVPATGLVAGTAAVLWFGTGPTWRLVLTVRQRDALRQLFLRCFWHRAVDEAWSSGGAFQFRPASERPFDVPEVTGDASVRLTSSSDGSVADERATHTLLNHAPPTDLSCRRLWTAPSGGQKGPLLTMLQAGCSVTWDKVGLPDASTDGRKGRLLLPGDEARLRVELSPEQASALLEVLDGPAAWSFQAGLELGAFADQPVEFWLPGADGAMELSREVRLDMPTVQPEELREVLEAAPAQWSPPPPLALGVVYAWEVLPPTVPNGAQDDPLVGQWRNVDRDWDKRLAVVRGALETAGGLRASIGKTFKRLMSSIMGFERDETKLQEELAALAAEQPSGHGPEGAEDLLGRLGKLEEEIGKLHVDLEQAEKKAREDEERARQQEAWASSVSAARGELPSKKAELEAARDEQGAVGVQFDEVEAALAEEQDKKKKKDLRARKHKLTDQRNRAAQRVRGLEQEIEALEVRVAEPFVYKPRPTPPSKKKDKGRRFVPSAPKKTIKAIPDDALPSVGVLKKHKGKRYVVIEDWSELDIGEAEARRLGAKLVAKEGT
ncbi:hypothetical protein G6O69_12195 [Pseudenhygromyxa sp. WMMC2535]|uniref:hypothetical protein n=1 Tax=Pseudenhygromyxa sp. WMMC2535 TaxID=2712867 RepID=UPI0015560AC5|nr:hypothetical protein [Pseudenhygromyxa sp. WMMC2535]NVB38593.1 hypothetical protein [Pseudenhygromyxa sp. WMMC2535]